MNEDNKIFKTNEFSIEISPVGKAIQAKDIQYFSYDENSGLQLIHILMDGKPLDLPNGTEIRLSAVKLNNQNQKLIYTPEIVDPLNGIVSFVIPREFLGYQGQIRCGLYINFSNNQTMHVGYFYINMGVSDIDTNLTEFTEDFWQGWSEFEAGSTAKMQELEQRIDEQTEIFNNADVYNKAEIEDKLEPFALRTDIDTLETKKADKTSLAKTDAEVAVARGVFNTLDERLTTKEQEVKAQLAQKAEQEDLLVERERITNIISLPEGSTTNDARLEDIKVGFNGTVFGSPGEAVRGQVEMMNEELNTLKSDIVTRKVSTNLLNINDINYKEGNFISPTTGTLTPGVYNTTGHMQVDVGKKIIKMQGNIAGEMGKGTMRFIAAYDASGNIMPTAGSSADVFEYIVPAGVKTIRASYINRSDYTKPMIAQVEPSDSGIPPYEAYFEPYYETKVVTDPTLTIENAPADARKVGEAFAEVNRNVTPYKNPTVKKNAATLGAGEGLSATEFPKMLKTGQVFTYTSKFANFGSEDTIILGFIEAAYGNYQSWLEVTPTRMRWLLSGTNAIVNELHGLTITDYLTITVRVSTDTGQLQVVMTTVGGTYTYKQTIDSTRANAIGTLTVKASMATTNVILTGACTQFRCETWLVGDSYFGVGPARVVGRMLEWGYASGVLLAGVGGLNSQLGYAELQRLLTFGTPKTLVWYVGMNDSQAIVNEYYPLIEQLCDQHGIELVFNRIPLVPSRLAANKAVNDYVLASGRRYIDSYTAVGADLAGNWYAGHLNADGVHPDPLGAAALTSRLIADVPEILSMS